MGQAYTGREMEVSQISKDYFSLNIFRKTAGTLEICGICFGFRLEHMKMHEKHKGHESMHAEMILILFATLIFSQIALVKWKQVYPSSYHVSNLPL